MADDTHWCNENLLTYETDAACYTPMVQRNNPNTAAWELKNVIIWITLSFLLVSKRNNKHGLLFYIYVYILMYIYRVTTYKLMYKW